MRPRRRGVATAVQPQRGRGVAATVDDPAFATRRRAALNRCTKPATPPRARHRSLGVGTFMGWSVRSRRRDGRGRRENRARAEPAPKSHARAERAGRGAQNRTVERGRGPRPPRKPHPRRRLRRGRPGVGPAAAREPGRLRDPARGPAAALLLRRPPERDPGELAQVLPGPRASG